MAGRASLSPLGSEFNTFLLAPICDDRNEMPLSVLSALARLDIDAWREAAELARMPGEAAAERLASLIAALPEGPSGRLDAGNIAAGLITLLPCSARPAKAATSTLPKARAPINLAAAVVHYLVIMVSVLAVQCLLASRQSPANAANGAVTSPAQHNNKVIAGRQSGR